MQRIQRFHLPALFCAFAVLACELIARPYANMSICDDGPYILMAQHLANTGHIVYNGWATAMLGWQLYLGAAFIKLFGFSFTSVRMSTLFISMALAFMLQRTFVRASISERNATFATLALVLSPLYLLLSVSFMTDITGLFAIVLCLYGCLRALQASTGRGAIGWLCFAVLTNAVFGTSRQIAWLGVLVMVPSTLWLLRAQRRVLIAGAVAAFSGALFIAASMVWLKHQPYMISVPLLASNFNWTHCLIQLGYVLLDIPFFLLPVVALFLPEVRKSRPRTLGILCALLLGFVALATYPSPLRVHFENLLEPTGGGPGSWINVNGIIEKAILTGTEPLFLHHGIQGLLTLISYGGLMGLFISLLHSRGTARGKESLKDVSWKQIGMLTAPFTSVYIVLLLSAVTTIYYLFDRYALGLLPLVLICLVRYYQERIHARLPIAAPVLIVLMAIYGVSQTHNAFELNRARVALAAELASNGVPATAVDGGWDYNFNVELQYSSYLNDPRIKIPANAYVPVPVPPAGPCQMFWYDRTPHIHPLYAISFDPGACYGPAPFAPVHYSRWPYLSDGTLYVVRFARASKP